MAVIVSTPFSAQPAHFAITETALTAADTLTYVQGAGQVLKLRNPSAGSLSIVIVGTAPFSVTVPGTGTVFSTAAGKSITVPAGQTVAVNLDKISAYLQGTAAAVAVTGGSGGFASILV